MKVSKIVKHNTNFITVHYLIFVQNWSQDTPVLQRQYSAVKKHRSCVKCQTSAKTSALSSAPSLHSQERNINGCYLEYVRNRLTTLDKERYIGFLGKYLWAPFMP